MSSSIGQYWVCGGSVARKHAMDVDINVGSVGSEVSPEKLSRAHLSGRVITKMKN